MLKSYFHYVPLALSQVLILPTACTTLCFALRWTTVDSNCCPSQSSTWNQQQPAANKSSSRGPEPPLISRCSCPCQSSRLELRFP
uniref:Putative secreted protein n=1 Tax=Ixodes ricinus TaxID=34613 RepID=A0A6B0U7M5_IXORI